MISKKMYFDDDPLYKTKGWNEEKQNRLYSLIEYHRINAGEAEGLYSGSRKNILNRPHLQLAEINKLKSKGQLGHDSFVEICTLVNILVTSHNKLEASLKIAR
jgi:hypothetical protein